MNDIKNLLIEKKTMKYIQNLDMNRRSQIKSALAGLLETPPLGDIKAVIGKPPLMRLRVGNYRIIFYVENNIVRILKVAPRGQAYKNMR